MNLRKRQSETARKVEHRASTPIAGAIAGILFAVLFSLSVSIMGHEMRGAAGDTGEWLAGDTGLFRFALSIMPFAGIFFLWFIAVSRERLGRHEDQFFSTIFLGSGLLFVALLFAAVAAGGALVFTGSRVGSDFISSHSYIYGRLFMAQVFSVYALRMAAIFQISQATLWLKTGVMPRWMAFLTYALALVLLFIFTQSQWVILAFPAWVLLVSVYILIVNLGRGARDEDSEPAPSESQGRTYA